MKIRRVTSRGKLFLLGKLSDEIFPCCLKSDIMLCEASILRRGSTPVLLASALQLAIKLFGKMSGCSLYSSVATLAPNARAIESPGSVINNVLLYLLSSLLLGAGSPSAGGQIMVVMMAAQSSVQGLIGWNQADIPSQVRISVGLAKGPETQKITGLF